MPNDATGVLWTRLPYFLSPQMSIYKHLAERVEGLRVLEIGFGTGFGTVQLAAKARRVVATEIDGAAVNFAQSVFPLTNVTWQKSDITTSERVPAFDAIVCLEVLEHIPDWRKALENIYGSMVRGGVLYISGPNANGTRKKGDLHEREWTAQEFSGVLHEFFSKVSLWDFSMTEEQGLDTRVTPLLAICHA